MSQQKAKWNLYCDAHVDWILPTPCRSCSPNLGTWC